MTSQLAVLSGLDIVIAFTAGTVFKEILKWLIYIPENCTIFIFYCYARLPSCLATVNTHCWLNEFSRCYLDAELLIGIITITNINVEATSIRQNTPKGV